ncbi:hypothetical protein AAY473_005555 [Plecturocebus cupreus]
MGFYYVGQAGLELLTSSDPFPSASQSTGIADERHCTWLSPPPYGSWKSVYSIHVRKLRPEWESGLTKTNEQAYTNLLDQPGGDGDRESCWLPAPASAKRLSWSLPAPMRWLPCSVSSSGGECLFLISLGIWIYGLSEWARCNTIDALIGNAIRDCHPVCRPGEPFCLSIKGMKRCFRAMKLFPHCLNVESGEVLLFYFSCSEVTVACALDSGMCRPGKSGAPEVLFQCMSPRRGLVLSVITAPGCPVSPSLRLAALSVIGPGGPVCPPLRLEALCVYRCAWLPCVSITEPGSACLLPLCGQVLLCPRGDLLCSLSSFKIEVPSVPRSCLGVLAAPPLESLWSGKKLSLAPSLPLGSGAAWSQLAHCPGKLEEPQGQFRTVLLVVPHFTLQKRGTEHWVISSKLCGFQMADRPPGHLESGLIGSQGPRQRTEEMEGMASVSVCWGWGSSGALSLSPGCLQLGLRHEATCPGLHSERCGPGVSGPCPSGLCMRPARCTCSVFGGSQRACGFQSFHITSTLVLEPESATPICLAHLVPPSMAV